LKRLKRKQFIKKSITVEEVGFEEAEIEKLELVKKHIGSKTNKEDIKALIFQEFAKTNAKK
jgi:hypothetical protein